MTNHSATPVHYPPKSNPTAPCVLQPTGNVSDSRLGLIISRSVAAKPVVTNARLSPDFLRVMDQIRLHIESKVVQAGHLGPLDFTYQDFADLFNDVAIGEARVALFRALNSWYKTVYVRQLHQEKMWRDFYEDDTLLTREQEVCFFNNMRSGSSRNAARWRDLFLHRNMGLVGRVVKFYKGKLHGLICWDRQNQELPTEWEILMEAGHEGLEKAVDKFKPELGNKFSTHAWKWINGAITEFFKKSKAELRRPEWLVKTGVLQGPRVAEDHIELCSTVEQALNRLNDPRKVQIVTMRYGLFGKAEHKLKDIAKVFDITPQRVRAIELATLKQLKQDRELRQFYGEWFYW